MKISTFLFRSRRAILILIFFFGFWAPWDRLGDARPSSTWLWLVGTLARMGILSIEMATIVVVAVATLLILAAASVRTWAAAYLGSKVVHDEALHGERLVADGPYRYVRNPLYLGMWLVTAGLSILMPPGGACFAVLTVTVLGAALIHAEEHHLLLERGEPYTAYLKRVPRILPAVSPKVPAGADRPRWLQGFLGEIHLWGIALTYALCAYRYEVQILEQGALISLGIAVLVRGFWRPARQMN